MCDAVVESTLAVRLFIPLVTWFFVSLVVGASGLVYTLMRRKHSAASWSSSSRSTAYASRTDATARADDGSWGVWRTGADLDEDELGVGPGGSSTLLSGATSAVTERPLESWQISPRELKLGPRIGVGNVGEVYRAVYRGRTVAVKKLLGAWTRDSDMVERFREEAYLMSTFSHPNVLGFKGAVLDRDAGQACIVMEFCERGTLADLLRSREPLPWQRRLRIARDISLGMNYLHAKAGIVNRDLKSTNLLLTRDYEVRISDFGLSRRNASGPGQAMLTYCGTPAYLAPEVVRQERYTEKADVYSFGIILWELLTREAPYASGAGVGGAAGAGAAGGLALAYAVATQGLRPPIPAYCPAEWAALMTACWAEDAASRPSFDEIQRALAAIIRAFDEQLKQQTQGHPGAHAASFAAAAAAAAAFPVPAPLSLALARPVVSSAAGAGAGAGVAAGTGVGPVGLRDSALFGAGEWLTGPPPSSLIYSPGHSASAVAAASAAASLPMRLPGAAVGAATATGALAAAPALPGSIGRAPSPPALAPLPLLEPAATAAYSLPLVSASRPAPAAAAHLGAAAVRGGGSSSVLTTVSDPRCGGSSSVLTVHSLGSAAGAGMTAGGADDASHKDRLPRDGAVSSLSISEVDADSDVAGHDGDADIASASGVSPASGRGSTSTSRHSSRASSSPADPSPAGSLPDQAAGAASGAGSTPCEAVLDQSAAAASVASAAAAAKLASPLLEVEVVIAGKLPVATASAVSAAPLDRVAKARLVLQMPGRLPLRHSADPSPDHGSDSHIKLSVAGAAALPLQKERVIEPVSVPISVPVEGMPPRGSSPRLAVSPAPAPASIPHSA